MRVIFVGGGLALDHSIPGVFTAGWKVILSFIQTALKWHYGQKDRGEEEHSHTLQHFSAVNQSVVTFLVNPFSELYGNSRS